MGRGKKPRPFFYCYAVVQSPELGIVLIYGHSYPHQPH
jgi:hypothetical protein